jgi:hypothetical protein
MDSYLYPTLKKVSVLIDPANVSQYTFTRQKPYLLIDLECPEVQRSALAAVARANCTVYEQSVGKFFAGNFQYDKAEIFQAEPRTIYNLNTLTGAFLNGKYLLVLVIIEFDGN